MTAKKITSLTQEQRDRMPSFAQEWIAHGFRTGDTDKPLAEAAIRKAYALAKLSEVPVMWVSSPFVGAFAAPIAANILSALQPRSLSPAVHNAVGDAVRNAVRDAVGDAMHNAVHDAVGNAVHDAVGDAMHNAVRNAVDSAVGNAVDNAVGNAVRDAVGRKIWWHTWIGFQLWPGLAAYAEFFRVHCGWTPHGDAATACDVERDLALTTPYIWPNKDFCMACERPTVTHMNARGQLHKNGAMAISWPDGWGLWMLNGVQVPQWIAETQESQLDPKRVVEIENADVRREFVRKAGIERITQALKATVVHSVTPVIGGQPIAYELLELTLGDATMRYLKMQNPSMEGIYHVERVEDSCATVEQAINFRNGFEAKQIKEDGADWYQHGDVVIVPRKAKTLKQWPAWIA
jgi:hypothetical protein